MPNPLLPIDIPPIADRLAVPVSFAAIEVLDNWVEDNLYHQAHPFHRAVGVLRIGWDLQRLAGRDDGEDIFLRWFIDAGGTKDVALAAWESFANRARMDSDALIIDLLDELLAHGVSLPPSETESIERLRDIAEARRVARVAAEKVAWEAEIDADRATYLLTPEGQAAEQKAKAFRATWVALSGYAAQEEERAAAAALDAFLNRTDLETESGEWSIASEMEYDQLQQSWRTASARLFQIRHAAENPTPPLPPGTPLPQNRPPTTSTEGEISIDDFVAFMPAHQYIFKPTREPWPASSVNARLPLMVVPGRDKPIAAAAWLDVYRPVEQITWAPGEPMEIRDKLIADGGWIHRAGMTVFNAYRPPAVRSQPGDASPWINHVEFVFGDDAKHIIRWLAHRVQRPQEKINHALVLGGAQGVGKDTLLEPVKQAVGQWNFIEVSPQQMLGRFNGFLKSVILRVSEARDLGDTDRFAFYDHMKAYTAAPPDVLRVDEKHLREHSILNVCGVIITTNHKSDGIYLPADDRRHFIAWSNRTKDSFPAGYWANLYDWFANGGTEVVAHHLASLDIGDFDAKAPPPKTQAFWEIVDASRAPEDAEMADALDQLKRPKAITLSMLGAVAQPDFRDWLNDRKNKRKIPHRLDECGYVPVRNPDAADGLWRISGRRQAVYANRDLTPRDQTAAAHHLVAAASGSSD